MACWPSSMRRMPPALMPPRPGKQLRRLSIPLITSTRRRRCTVVPDAHRSGDRGGPGRQHRDGTAPVALQEGADGRAGPLLGVTGIAGAGVPDLLTDTG